MSGRQPKRGADLTKQSVLKQQAAIGMTNKRSEAQERRMVALVEARERTGTLEPHRKMQNPALWAPRPHIEVVYGGVAFEVVWDGA